MFSTYQQKRDWLELQKAIDAAPVQIPCVSWPEAFFPDQGDLHAFNLALKACGACPVQKDCLLYGLKWERDGVWGGMGARDRANLRASRGLAIAPESVA